MPGIFAGKPILKPLVISALAALTLGTLIVTGASTFNGPVGFNATTTHATGVKGCYGDNQEFCLSYAGGMGVVTTTGGEVHFFPTVGIGSGTSSVAARLRISDEKAPAAGTVLGMYLEQTVSASVNGLSAVGGYDLIQTSSTSAANYNIFAARQSVGRHRGSGVMTDLRGQNCDAELIGTGPAQFMSGCIGRLLLSSNANSGSGYALFAPSPVITGAGAFGALTGLRIDPMIVGTSTNYAIHYNNGSDSAVLTGGGQWVIGGTTTTNSMDNGTKVRLENFGVASTTRLIVSSSTQSGGGLAGRAMCWKADGKTLGFCSSVVGVAGDCTCN